MMTQLLVTWRPSCSMAASLTVSCIHLTTARTRQAKAMSSDNTQIPADLTRTGPVQSEVQDLVRHQGFTCLVFTVCLITGNCGLDLYMIKDQRQLNCYVAMSKLCLNLILWKGLACFRTYMCKTAAVISNVLYLIIACE